LGRIALAVAALAVTALPQAMSPAAFAAKGAAKPDQLRQDPRSWLPVDESLRFKVEVTLGPVRGLDVGSVTLTCVQTPASAIPLGDAPTDENGRRLIASIDGVAKGGYLGRDVHHAIGVRWFVGSRPRIECVERLTGSRVSDRELRVGELDGQWQLEYRKDRHCKGCNDTDHFTVGALPWSRPSHCDDCQRPNHRVWRDYKYLDVPADAIDIVSALYFARGFLRSDAESTSLALVNQDELWNVHLKRGGTRKIETPAGEFDCVRVLIGPELAAGDGPGKKGAARFEALFGLHGDISVWVDRVRGIPVLIQGTAPLGPFNVHVKASLTSHRGG
jgi:hypothetical protein